ncbi:MAG TPA: hypothetical protein VEU72_06080 [Nitrosopumilaceae archaeon]|nr:hypothetical protein [Nitrosopumilaceae archaeon]
MKYAKIFFGLVLAIIFFTLTPTQSAHATTGILYGADISGNLFAINVSTGAGTLIGTIPGGSTEITCKSDGSQCFNQQPPLAFLIQQFDPSNGNPIGPPVFDGASFTGLRYVGSTLYGTYELASTGPSTFATLDPVAGTHTNIGLTGVGPITGLAYDTVNNIMYGVSGSPSSPSNLYTINLGTGHATLVFNTNIPKLGSLSFGPDGKLYAGSGVNGAPGGELYRIDPIAKTITDVGPTSFNSVNGLTSIGSTTPPSIPDFPFSFNLVIIFVAVAAVYMGIRQKMTTNFKHF